MTETQKKKTTSKVLKLDILSITNEARNMHGLRHQDYQRYRQYCTQKIERLRHKLNLTQANKKKFKSVPLTVRNTRSFRHLYIPLFEAERAWSFAMQLKRESIEEPRKKRHLIRRLRRASAAAKKLEDICAAKEGKVDTRTLLEAQAYSALMSGYTKFEEQDWESALVKFATARTIYEKLGPVGTAEQEALCHSAIDALEPNIRYCTYNIQNQQDGGDIDLAALIQMKSKAEGMGLDLLAGKVESALSLSHHEKATKMDSISWLSRKLPIRNTKLAEAIISADELGSEIDRYKSGQITSSSEINSDLIETELNLYDKVLAAYASAESIAKSDVKEHEVANSKVVSSKTEESGSILRYLHAYTTHLLFARTIERDLLLIKKVQAQLEQLNNDDKKYQAKLEELVKLYDTIVQNVGTLRDLPAIRNEIDYVALNEAKYSIYRGYKLLYVAQIYSTASNYEEALAIYDHISSSLLPDANVNVEKSKRLDKTMKSDLDNLRKKLKELERLVRGNVLKTKAAFWMKKEEQMNSMTSSLSHLQLENQKQKKQSDVREAPLIDNLQEFRSSFDTNNMNLVDFPPTFIPMPCKPLFFDLAFGKIASPEEISNEILSAQENQVKGPTSAISGFLSGIWGRKK